MTAVGIAGWAQTPIVPADPRSIPEMVLAVVEDALADSGRDWPDIDAVVTASVDLFDGLTASNIAVAEVVGSVMKPETRIAADGLAVAIQASMQISAGAYDTVLVVAHGKASMADHWDLTAWAMDPVYLQPLGADFLVAAGLQARAVAGGDETAEQRWAELIEERTSSSAGPAFRSAAEVMASPYMAAPIRAAMAAPLGDGACAVVLHRGSSSGVVMSGSGHDLAPHHLGDRDLATADGLARALTRALRMAGLEKPSFDLAEPCCLFPHEEELVRSVIAADTPVSPTGGLFGGAAPVVAGLSRLLAAADAVRSGHGQRALAHGAWGPAGQAQAVAIVEAA